MPSVIIMHCTAARVITIMAARGTRWLDGAPQVRSFVPKLSPSIARHKGSCGRIAVLGGSAEYTGAPFYGAMAALKVGADLSFVFTAAEACLPIKCYGPELMVLPMYEISEFGKHGSDDDLVQASVRKVEEMLPRVHALLIGPGLGRHPAVLRIAADVIKAARALTLPMVIDADGMFLVAERPDLVRGCDHLVLTPNIAEFRRLRDAVLGSSGSSGSGSSGSSTSGSSTSGSGSNSSPPDHAAEVAEVSAALGNVVILLKGASDVVSDGRRTLVSSAADEAGSPRRCGGLGDILSGATLVLLNWALRDASGAVVDAGGGGNVRGSGGDAEAAAREVEKGMGGAEGSAGSGAGSEAESDDSAPTPAMWAAWAAAILTKRSAAAAFAIHMRSTTAPDVLDHIGPVAQVMFPV